MGSDMNELEKESLELDPDEKAKSLAKLQKQ